jgi:EAL domain-containing protein (putative c-di-GMP-specific phosphodiesterase class I)/CheY-like chemotaxis protein
MNEPSKKNRILVVDDDPFALKLLVRQLTQMGHEVIAYESANEALGILEAADHIVDVVFSDLQMPAMDGVEFVRQLVRAGYDGHLVLVSGEDPRILKSAEKLASAHGLRVLGSLSKPATREQLQQRLAASAITEWEPAKPQGVPYQPDELQAAIAEGQFVAYYQPQVALSTGSLLGVEALVRWQHPRDGVVTADQFVSLAELYGLVDDLTRAVLPAALRQAADWRKDGTDLRLAVNLSMDNLVSLDFPDFVVDTAEATGFPLSKLVLEITETRLKHNRLVSLDIMTRLRLKRISLSIDDFGTGHASLAHLRDIPFDELKIDRTFIHGACRDESLNAIVKASLSLARQLNMSTVAEGVENAEDWHFLRAMSCDLAQGYFIGRPMPSEQLHQWHADWQCRYADLGSFPAS